MRPRSVLPLLPWLSFLLLACGDAQAPRGGGTTASLASGEPREVAAAAPAAASSPAAMPSTSAAPAGSASASAAPVTIDLAKHPELLDADGKPLPQTDDRPSVDAPAFQRRLELLWKAIVRDDPTLATEAVFFPKVAYAQVKDIKNPEADWSSRLVRAFERNVHEYHRDLGDKPEAARFVKLVVDEKRVRLMERGKEGNKLPYHRVTRSKIHFVDGSGKERTLELTSLIAWRGEWFVVHLHGFK